MAPWMTPPRGRRPPSPWRTPQAVWGRSSLRSARPPTESERLAGGLGLVGAAAAMTPRMVLLMLLLGMAAGCTLLRGRHAPVPATSSPPSTPASRTTTIVTLLADNHLLVATADPARVVADLRLGPAPEPLGVSHAMALTADGSTLYLLVPRGADQPRAPDQLVTFDLATRQVRARHPLDAATSYRSLALGPRSGQLYLFGNRHQAAGQAAVVAMVDPAAGTVRSRWTIRPAGGRTWLVYRGVVSDDERHLVVSYHGPDTTGADVLTKKGDRLARCATATRPEAGCLASVPRRHNPRRRAVAGHHRGPTTGRGLDPRRQVAGPLGQRPFGQPPHGAGRRPRGTAAAHRLHALRASRPAGSAIAA